MTTNITKPTKLPEFDTNQTNIVEPDTTHKDDGWSEVSPGLFEKPPAEYFNYWMNLVYLWLQSIDSFTDEATETDRGTVELATQTEVNTGTDTTRVVTPATLNGRTATETLTGLVELATQTEVITGTDTSRAVTPATLKGQKSIFVNNSNGNPNISDTFFDIAANITQSTWESVGPSDAGSPDNTWSALDDLPDDIDWIEVNCIVSGITATGTASAIYTTNAYARKNGSSSSNGDVNRFVYETATANASGYASVGGAVVPGYKIPVSSKVFDLYWITTFATTNLVKLYLTGYGYN